jgi:hypothetical protein
VISFSFFLSFFANSRHVLEGIHKTSSELKGSLINHQAFQAFPAFKSKNLLQGAGGSRL